jgi:hypothetical protein
MRLCAVVRLTHAMSTTIVVATVRCHLPPPYASPYRHFLTVIFSSSPSHRHPHRHPHTNCSVCRYVDAVDEYNRAIADGDDLETLDAALVAVCQATAGACEHACVRACVSA